MAEILQESLATELKQRQYFIAQNVGLIVNRAIEDAPELTQLLRLIPIVGGRIEQQIQSIGQRLGKHHIRFTGTNGGGNPAQPNATYRLIAEKVSDLKSIISLWNSWLSPWSMKV